MDDKVRRSIANLAEYLADIEGEDWEREGEPDEGHIYLDVVRVQKWLDKSERPA